MTVAAPPANKLTQYINGQWTDSHATEFRDVVNPATGEVVATVPLGGADDVNAAVEAAAAAFPEWRRTPPEDRIQPLFKLKMLLEEHIDDIARIITTENGKTFTEAKAEMRRAIENVEVACGIPDDDAGLQPRRRGARHRRNDDPTTARRDCGHRAIQFSRHDRILVFAVRHRDRQHIYPEAE